MAENETTLITAWQRNGEENLNTKHVVKHIVCVSDGMCFRPPSSFLLSQLQTVV